MSMSMECYGYEMIILQDRYDEARAWLEDVFGLDILSEHEDGHEALGDGRMSLSLGDTAFENGIWGGSVGYGSYDDLEDFVREFGCEGTYFKISTDADGTWYTMLKAAGRELLVESCEESDLFPFLEERMAAREQEASRMALISRIADRALGDYPDFIYKPELVMDIAAADGEFQLRLEELLTADRSSFWHDVGGIVRHMDRSAGRLAEGFIPMFATPPAQSSDDAGRIGALGDDAAELKALAEGVRTDLGTLRNILMHHSGAFSAQELEDALGNIDGNAIPDAIDRVADRIRERGERTAGAHGAGEVTLSGESRACRAASDALGGREQMGREDLRWQGR